MRGQTTSYHAFVRRADGRWRSAPLIVRGEYTEQQLRLDGNLSPGETGE